MYDSVWLTVMSFEALLFTISIAFILLAMAKERTELRHRTAALVDPLTGIANRRSFLQDAGQLAKRHSGDPHPTAALLIDLDHFKSINDRFGHALGDRVLEIFSEVARKSMRSTDLLGRLGGEEFAAVLYDTSRDKAVAVAERIRESFAYAAQEVDGRPVGATLSIGLAYCEEAALDVSELLAQSDQALYFAKEHGRNRVEVASLEMMMERAPDTLETSAEPIAVMAAKATAKNAAA
jgi:diguanylate cyclase (GGDEF)-like protein